MKVRYGNYILDIEKKDKTFGDQARTVLSVTNISEESKIKEFLVGIELFVPGLFLIPAVSNYHRMPRLLYDYLDALYFKSRETKRKNYQLSGLYSDMYFLLHLNNLDTQAQDEKKNILRNCLLIAMDATSQLLNDRPADEDIYDNKNKVLNNKALYSLAATFSLLKLCKYQYDENDLAIIDELTKKNSNFSVQLKGLLAFYDILKTEDDNTQVKKYIDHLHLQADEAYKRAVNILLISALVTIMLLALCASLILLHIFAPAFLAIPLFSFMFASPAGFFGGAFCATTVVTLIDCVTIFTVGLTLGVVSYLFLINLKVDLDFKIMNPISPDIFSVMFTDAKKKGHNVLSKLFKSKNTGDENRETNREIDRIKNFEEGTNPLLTN
jgi:uncharacterized membrane protein (DUF485 family)